MDLTGMELGVKKIAVFLPMPISDVFFPIPIFRYDSRHETVRVKPPVASALRSRKTTLVPDFSVNRQDYEVREKNSRSEK